MSHRPGDYRPSRARFVTLCADCGEVVGVTQEKFNRTDPDIESRSDPVWRATVHRNKATNARCLGARTVVHQNLVWERSEVSA